MTKERAHKSFSKRDIELIVGVVVSAHREGLSVAQVVRQRLVQNETALTMFRKPKTNGRASRGSADAGDPMYRLITAETQRILRLQRKFASWRGTEPGEREAK